MVGHMTYTSNQTPDAVYLSLEEVVAILVRHNDTVKWPDVCNIVDYAIDTYPEFVDNCKQLGIGFNEDHLMKYSIAAACTIKSYIPICVLEYTNKVGFIVSGFTSIARPENSGLVTDRSVYNRLIKLAMDMCLPKHFTICEHYCIPVDSSA